MISLCMDSAYKALVLGLYKDGTLIDGVSIEAFKKQRIKVDREQAEKTAWRNVRDWILAQMAFIKSGNVEVDEIFLPYLTDGKKTLYQAYKTGQLLLSDGGNTYSA